MAHPVYKIIAARAWASAVESGRFQGAAIDLADGYIHLSAPHQVRETAARHFAGQGELLLVAFDAAALGGALKWEPSRGGDLFPHFYGVLDTRQALSAEPIPLASDGRHLFPGGIP